MLHQSLSFVPVAGRLPAGGRIRRGVAFALHRASAALARLALRVVARRAHGGRPGEPLLEFYAEAGAPEGALYVDGVLVGSLAGVTRL